MRIAVIVLVIVAVGFYATLGYGVANDRNAGPVANGECGGPIPMRDGEPDRDALEDWCPPDFAAAFEDLAREFAETTRLPDPTISLAGEGNTQNRALRSRRNDEPRLVELQLVAGEAARIEIRQQGKGTEIACLCRPGSNPPPSEFSGCSPSWRANQSGPNGCSADADSVRVAVGRRGALFRFTSEREARIVSR